MAVDISCLGGVPSLAACDASALSVPSDGKVHFLPMKVASGIAGISGLSTCDASALSIPADGRVHWLPARAEPSSESIRLDFEIKIPKKEKPPKPKPPPPPPPKPKKVEVAEKVTEPSKLSGVFVGGPARCPQPIYFQEVDCVGLPDLLTSHECAKILECAEAQGYSRQQGHEELRMDCCDLLDPLLSEGLWNFCGLGSFLSGIAVNGMVPCGLNDVVRIQRYREGDRFGRHTDQVVRRKDGRVSKYSLRVFLNGVGEGFEGGLSAFHVHRASRPVVFEPEEGLGLLYPQGELCTVQEEMEVRRGCKYVLRADVLFRRR